MDRRSWSLSVAALVIASIAGTANAQVFFPNNLVVNRIGDGSGALGSAAVSSTLVEYTRAGALTGASVTLNAGASGTRLTNSGSATSEGFLSSTADQRYILNAGYNAASGTAGIAGTTAATVNRVIGITDTWTGTTTYSAFDGTVFNANNIRSAAADSITGPTSIIYGAGGNSGIRQTTVAGGVAGTQVSGATVVNWRNLKTFDIGGGTQVFSSSASGAATGINLITGTGFTNIIGTGLVSGISAYDFFFANDRTLYIADDRNTGGLLKLARTGGVSGDATSGTWSLVYSVALPTVAGTTGLRGLAGEVSGGLVNLFAVSAEASANRLVSISDTLAGTSAGSFTILATAATNTIFRGVTLVPTPGTAALLGLGGLLAARRRRI